MHSGSIRSPGARAANTGAPPACQPTIDLQSPRRFRGVSLIALRRAARTLLCAGLGLPRAELSLSLVDDAAMQALNAQWRHKDRTTDVLAFPLQAPQIDRSRRAPAVPVALGDIVLCVPQAARQASPRGHGLQDELHVLLTHGLLHLLGHDHVHGGRQAARMRREETRLLSLLSPPGTLLRCLLASADGS